MIAGNIGEWSEPYALMKLLADGKLYLGDENFNKIKGLFYPILKVIRHEKNRVLNFSYNDSLIIITDGRLLFEVPVLKFVKNAKTCFDRIKKTKKGTGSFEIPEIEDFLASFSVLTLKAKSKLKNDITIQVEDPNTFLSPSLGFSIKSQLGRPATLVNASGATNFTYLIKGKPLSNEEVSQIENTRIFSKKLDLIKSYGAFLEFETVDNCNR